MYNGSMARPTVFNHKYLLDLVKEQLGDHEVVVKDDGWTVHDETLGAVFGLVNLAQHLDGIDERLWRDRVGEWVQRLLRIRPAEPGDYHLAAPRLRVRLAADASEPGWAVHRPVCAGLDEMLMLRPPFPSCPFAETVLPRYIWGMMFAAMPVNRMLWLPACL